MHALFECMSMHHVYVWCPEARRGCWNPWIGVKDSCEPHVGASRTYERKASVLIV